ncbi:GntR family transcriptional regulator [Streptomyces radicis]|uniref:GntR family transcriptional regulator n=1 Tax=Streptomyces radicis TaxID=1750517 RepID=UPI0016002D32|nr:GntR family transcriptional regulator [Streptomyces radicis]
MADQPLTQADPLYTQLAARLAAAILDGTYPPGSRLPGTPELSEKYGVSRITVRSAVRELRAMGLLAPHQTGRPVYVAHPARRVSLDLGIARANAKAPHQLATALETTGDPAITRVLITDPQDAVLLHRDASNEAPAFAADRKVTVGSSLVRALHRVLLPYDVITGTTVETTPEAEPTAIYDALAAAGHPLTWDTHTTARPCRPGEHTALGLNDATETLLVVHRVTLGRDARPLTLETLRIPAAQADLIHHSAATKPRR